MSILIGIIPALGWGFMPLIATKIGGDYINKIMGTTYATFITALIVFLFTQPHITTTLLLMGMLSGAFWATGQMLQYKLFQELNVSIAMPLSMGLQTIGTALIGVLAFGNWPETSTKIIGLLAIIGIIVGMCFTSVKSKNDDSPALKKASLPMLILTFIVSTIGFLGYNIFPQLVNADPLAGFLPQGIGMAIMSTIFALFSGHKQQRSYFKDQSTWGNLLSGACFGIAAYFYILSARKNGIATGFALTQMSVVISTLGGILLLHEHKTHHEFVYTMIGLALVLAGGVTIGIM